MGARDEKRRQQLRSHEEQFNDALCRLVREVNLPCEGSDYVSLCRESFGVWTIMGLEECEFVEIRLLGMVKFDIEVILRHRCSLQFTIRRAKSVYENLLCAFEAITAKRQENQCLPRVIHKKRRCV